MPFEWPTQRGLSSVIPNRKRFRCDLRQVWVHRLSPWEGLKRTQKKDCKADIYFQWWRSAHGQRY